MTVQSGNAFGGRLRQLRESAGLTQEELAERAELSLNAIGALERGDRRHPYPRTIRVLAAALEISEDERIALVALQAKRARLITTPVKCANSDVTGAKGGRSPAATSTIHGE